MAETMKIKNSRLSVTKGDITDIGVDSFVFYASDDLKLGSGFGNAIALRGGPSIRKELEGMGPVKVTEAVATTAGNMKAKYIIHADGPKFQEENMEGKLKATIENTLKCADEKGVDSIALPPMGAGFYGVPLDISARITVNTVAEYLMNGTELKNVIICAMDNREYKPVYEALNNLN
jgi:O-acetyl-ADP-ribose deacetylase (regulator of RNase III)